MRFLLSLFCVLFLSFNSYSYQALDVHTGVLSKTSSLSEPEKEITTTNNSISITYNFHQIYIKKSPIHEQSYSIYIPGFGTIHDEGAPDIPIKYDSYSLPNGNECKLTLGKSSYVEYDLTLAPAIHIMPDIAPTTDLPKEITPIQIINSFIPESLVEISSYSEYRGLNNVTIAINPIQYNSQTKKVRVYSQITYNLDFTPKQDLVSSENKTHGVYDLFPEQIRLYSKSIDNQLQFNANIRELTQDLLILTTPTLEPAARRLADWRSNFGYRVTIISKDSWSPDIIYQETTAFNDDNPRYSALLILGSHSLIPSDTSNLYKWEEWKAPHLTDLYYACYGGEDDFFPDVFHGRIPVDNLEDANIIIDKIISYEKDPPIEEDFYKTGTNIAYFEPISGIPDREKSMHIEYSEKIRNFLSNNNYNISRIYSYAPETTKPQYYYDKSDLPSDLLSTSFNWQGNTNDIINAINSHSLYALYLGHGWTDSWYSPRIHLSSFNRLKNIWFLPVVFSMSCLTGDFSNECFATEFLKQQNAGCAAILASTYISANYCNNEIAYGMLSNILSSKYDDFDSPQYNLGTILDFGMIELASHYSSDWQKYHWELYNWFGDPTMNMWTKKPQRINNTFTSYNNGILSVYLNDLVGKITFHNINTGESETYSGMYANFITSSPNSIRISVIANNKLPLIITPSSAESKYTPPTPNSFGIISCRLINSTLSIEYDLTSERAASIINAGRLAVINTEGVVYHNISLSEQTGMVYINTSKMPKGIYSIVLIKGSETSSMNITIN